MEARFHPPCPAFLDTLKVLVSPAVKLAAAIGPQPVPDPDTVAARENFSQRLTNVISPAVAVQLDGLKPSSSRLILSLPLKTSKTCGAGGSGLTFETS